MKKNITIIFVITGVIFGLLFIWQFNIYSPFATFLPVDELEAKDDLIKDYLDEQSYLQSRIVFLREQIEDYETDIKEQTQENNIQFLENLKRDIGLTEITGKGLEITLNDGPFALRDSENAVDVYLIQAADVRDVINVLFAANADAISINNQRIIATSSISSVGSNLLVNNSHIAPPFYINAVGDIEIMLQRLLNENSLSVFYERIAENNLEFQIAKKQWVTVPIYNGDLKVNYLNLVN